MTPLSCLLAAALFACGGDDTDPGLPLSTGVGLDQLVLQGAVASNGSLLQVTVTPLGPEGQVELTAPDRVDVFTADGATQRMVLGPDLQAHAQLLSSAASVELVWQRDDAEGMRTTVVGPEPFIVTTDGDTLPIELSWTASAPDAMQVEVFGPCLQTPVLRVLPAGTDAWSLQAGDLLLNDDAQLCPLVARVTRFGTVTNGLVFDQVRTLSLDPELP